ncbi:10813_t:CDS:2 [Entrophospora sp. SA101]|nr:10813_t:CDS:2 [Entrophospora sp. SA101]
MTSHIGQEPPDDYLDKVVQSWAFAEEHMTVLENANAGDFDDAVKCTILKSKMAGKYAPVPANDPFTHGNPAINSPATLRHDKSELALVPTTSLQPTQSQKTQVLQSRQKQSDNIDYPRVPDKYMPERPPDRYGVYSEKFIHANLINPTPTSNQVIESVAKDVYEKVMDKISSFLPKKKNNTPNNDDMDEITKGMSELSINKAIAKGISQGIKAVHDNNVSSQHRCSNCYSLGHNSRKCPYPRKRNRKNRKSRSKKRGSVNKWKGKPEKSLSKKSGSKKRQSLKSPIQRSSQKIQKNSESLRTTRNVAVDFIPGCTICSDFAVVKYPKPMLILPNTLLDKYDYDLLTSKRELKLVCNGKEYFIPINMHKVKSKLEVNCATATRDDKSLVSDQISQEVDSNEGDNEPLEEEWHAPMDFSLESTNSTLKKNA